MRQIAVQSGCKSAELRGHRAIVLTLCSPNCEMMSELGHLQTFPAGQVVSAIPPIPDLWVHVLDDDRHLRGAQ